MTWTSSLTHPLSLVIPIVDIDHMAGNILFWSNAIPGNGRLERFDSETNCFKVNRVCCDLLQHSLLRNKSDCDY